MTDHAQYQIGLADPDALDEFVREYVLDAIDRISNYEESTYVNFAPAGSERSSIVVAFGGDPDSVFEKERPRLASLRDAGLVTGWEAIYEFSDAELESMFGEQSTVLRNRLGDLSARMAKLAYEEFDSFPAAVDTYPEESEETGPTGWWMLLHTLTVQANYDVAEELDAYRQGIEHSLRNVAEYDGAEAVDTHVNELQESLEGMREDVKEGRRGG